MVLATLLSACQSSPAAPISTDQSKDEKAFSESKVMLTVEGQASDQSISTPTSKK